MDKRLMGLSCKATTDVRELKSVGWANVGLLLGQRCRRWANSNPTLGQRLMFAGIALI